MSDKPKPVEFKPGDRVVHRFFGRGRLVKLISQTGKGWNQKWIMQAEPKEPPMLEVHTRYLEHVDE